MLTRCKRTRKEVAESTVLMVHGGPPSYSNQAFQRRGFIVPSRIRHFGSPPRGGPLRRLRSRQGLPTGRGRFVGWHCGSGAAPRLGVTTTPEPSLGFDDQGARVSSGDKGVGEDKEAGVAAEIRQTGLRLRNNGLGGNMATAGRMKRAWGDMRR